MKSLIVGDKPTVQRLAERLKRASSHSEYQRHSFSARRPAGCCWWTTCSRPPLKKRHRTVERKYLYSFSAVSPHDGVLSRRRARQSIGRTAVWRVRAAYLQGVSSWRCSTLHAPGDLANTTPTPRPGSRRWPVPIHPRAGSAGRVLWLCATLATGGIGAIASVGAASFYNQLTQPAWAPPTWLFGPAWSVLYVLMGIAAWLVWCKHGFRGAASALAIFVAQLFARLGITSTPCSSLPQP